MNQIKAIIRQIESVDNLNIVKFDFYGHGLQMMSLGLNDDIRVGREVILGIKPTHIAIGKDFSALVSCPNQLKAKICACKNGKLLSSIKLVVEDVVLESIITVASTLKMNLRVDDEVTVLINASELSILKVL